MKIKSILAIFVLASTMTASANILPEWHGYWQGECQYQAPGTSNIEYIPFTLEIAPLTSNEVSWKMNHMRASGDEIRDYIVRGVDVTAGHYEVDEQNGIVIDKYLRNNRLMQNFEVNKRQITIAFELDGNSMKRSAYAFSSSYERRYRKAGVTVYGDPSLDACSLAR